MKRYKLLVAAALLALPSMFVSGPGYSTSQLPEINAAAGQYRQQTCPSERGYGCFNLDTAVGANGMISIIFSNAERFGRAQLNNCLQVLQSIRSFTIGAG